MREYLFVYGTLRSQFSNRYAEELRRAGELAGMGRVRGRLYRIGAYPREYPGLVLLDTEDEWVEGEVYQLGSDAILRTLDVYEGCGPDDLEPHEYRRVVAPVVLGSGEWIRAWLYCYRRSVASWERIERFP